MLSPTEEGFLRRFIKERTPLSPTPAPAPPAPNGAPVGAVVKDALGKLPTTKMAVADINDDVEVRLRVQHTMRNGGPLVGGEKLSQWYARTGLSRAQVLTMTKAEITAFVKAREDNQDDVREPTPQPAYKDLIRSLTRRNDDGVTAVLVG